MWEDHLYQLIKIITNGEFSFQIREILVLELSVWAVYTMFMLHLKSWREKLEILSAML